MSTTASDSPPALRAGLLTALAGQTFDLVVIGGGITGAGIARDAALRGLQVALIDKGDFASGTSSKSTKLVHGGLRYLEQGQVRLVFESVHERATLLRLAPHIVRPQEFLTPSYRGDRPGLFVMDCGLWLYDALSGFTSPKLHHTYRRKHVEGLEPGLRKQGLRGGIVYYDCATDDARLTIENIVDARALGAVALNHVRATRLLREGDRFVGVEVEDLRTGQGPIAVRGRVVINATGPWCDEIRQMYGAERILGPTKGVHIVVDAARFPIRRALLVREKKRVVFLLPWGHRSVIGTTDTFYDGAPDDVFADRADVEYLLDVGNYYYPDSKLALEDVLATWSGLRPLLRPPAAAAASAVSREHHLESAPGLVTIAGGKLTTYRRMAAEVVDVATRQLERTVPASSTGERALPGGVGVDGSAGIDAIAVRLAGTLPEDIAAHLAQTYGARCPSIEARIAREPALAERLDPELPFIAAEIDEAVEVEQAVELGDLLQRRVPLSLYGRDQGLALAERAARRMASRLGWSDAESARELDRYRAAIDNTRRFRA
jgi:glycerol-3-phosphate dehydrogenase